LRVLFQQAARVVLRLRSESWERHGLMRWIEAAATRMHYNKLVIALANKLACISCSVLHRGRDFQLSSSQGQRPRKGGSDVASERAVVLDAVKAKPAGENSGPALTATARSGLAFRRSGGTSMPT